MTELDLNYTAEKIALKQISKNALSVLTRLHKAGYQSYLVGGAVRDLLLEQSPKDFDVATNATPEQIKKEFKNCRLIGRRFRLAHILFGREMIEVATFRGPHDSEENPKTEDRTSEEKIQPAQLKSKTMLAGLVDQVKNKFTKKEKSNKKSLVFENTGSQSETGMLLRDNIYGTMEEDVLRRDFTVNALYFDHYKRKIFDYVGGLDDLNKRIIRLIGDPETRYREDPVRMLRAVRFAAKLQMDIAPQTAQPIPMLASLLKGISSPRLFDESLKLLQNGHSVRTVELLLEYNLFKPLFPMTYEELTLDLELDEDPARAFIMEALRSTDQRIADNMGVNPAFLFAVLLWHPLQSHFEEICMTAKLAKQDLFMIAMNDILSAQVKVTAIPKRYSFIIRDIWQLQYRLEQCQARRANKLLEHARFRAAFDFLEMRARTEKNERLTELAHWWHVVQFAEEGERQKMISKLNIANQKSSPKKNGRKKKEHNNVSLEN